MPSPSSLACRALLLASLALATACATPVGVAHIDATQVHRGLTANVLSSDTLSRESRQVLSRLDLLDAWDASPPEAIAKLHSILEATGHPNRLFTLAETSFAWAERSGDRRYALAAALYAYTFLFPDDTTPAPSPYDPRFRLACDLYNRGLALGLKDEKTGQVRIEPGLHALPFGTLQLDVDPTGLRWGGWLLGGFESAADLEVRGLRNRYRRPGLGMPLAASLTRDRAVSARDGRHIPRGWKVPVTAVAWVDAPRRALGSGEVHARLAVYAENRVDTVKVGDVDVPLEFEPTSALASTLEGSPIWDLEIAGFLATQLGMKTKPGLIQIEPHRTGRVPVVLVHGTASSAARWADVVNELNADARVRDRVEIWLFQYHTGNPIPLSAMQLREALRDMVQELDPTGADPALRDMVVIGHSQGGLLTKMMVVDSGDAFWDLVSDRPLDSLDLSPRTRGFAHDFAYFDPSPFVRRVVFVATPHRGSYLVGGFVQALANALISLPMQLLDTSNELRRAMFGGDEARMTNAIGDFPRSIDQMRPGDPFLEALLSRPIAPGVVAHSIIAAEGEGALQDLSDGVVRYESAHVDGVESELVVRSGHSTQSHPQTILEIRRILREHLGLDR